MPIDTPQTVQVPAATLAQMQADSAQLQQLVAQRELDAAAANIRAQAAAGQVESLARSHRQEIEAERERAGNVAKRAELALALSQHQLAPGAVGQLAELWSGTLRVDPSPNGYAVRTASYQDVPTFVSEQLSRPEYAHFKGGSQPAAPASTGAPAAPAQPAEQPAPPKNYGEAILFHAAAAKAARDAANTGHTTTDLSKGFGLGKGPAVPSFALLARSLALK
jgi:hypothetical protein